MGVGELFAKSGIGMPSFAGAMDYVFLAVGAMFMACLCAGVFYIVLLQLKYNKNIVLWEKSKGRMWPLDKDKGMMQRVGTAGDYLLKAKKYKKTLPRPKIKMGKNTYWYYIREDGEWINFGLGDIDEQMQQSEAYYVDEDMRLQRLGVQRNLTHRFIKQTFWQKHGAAVMHGLFLMIETVCLVVLFKEMNGNWAAATSAANAVEHMAASVANLKGASVVPAGLFCLLPRKWLK